MLACMFAGEYVCAAVCMCLCAAHVCVCVYVFYSAHVSGGEILVTQFAKSLKIGHSWVPEGRSRRQNPNRVTLSGLEDTECYTC